MSHCSYYYYYYYYYYCISTIVLGILPDTNISKRNRGDYYYYYYNMWWVVAVVVVAARISDVVWTMTTRGFDVCDPHCHALPGSSSWWKTECSGGDRGVHCRSWELLPVVVW